PGWTCLPTSWSAWAAMRPATRMRSMISGVLTSGSPVLGRFLPTYSGRTMWAGTFRMGETRPGWSSVVMKHESTGQNGPRDRWPVVVLSQAHAGRTRDGMPQQGPDGTVRDRAGSRGRAGARRRP